MDDIVPSFLAASAISGARPELTRALLLSQDGQDVRAERLVARRTAITHAVGDAAPSLDAVTRRRFASLLADLCSSRAWVELHFGHDLPVDEARAAVADLIGVTVAELRRRQRDAEG